MAYEGIGQVCITLPAGADLSAAANQYKFVEITTAGKVTVANAAGEKVVGVLQNKPKSDEPATVCVWGVTKVRADETLDEGDLIATSADGEAKKVAAAASGTGHVDTSDAGAATDPVKGSFVMGIVIGAGGAAGTYATALLNPMGAVPTTAV